MSDLLSTATAPNRTPMILCVDDERMILTSLKEQLRSGQLGVDIEIAESGGEALEVVQELIDTGTPFPVIISDQVMPGMRGEELLEKIHKLQPETLCILLTGQATADAVGEAVNRANLYRYIGKPWTEDDLMQTVREALRAWEQARLIEARDQELRDTHAASLRFVPREFLQLLARERLTEVQRGDYIVRPMHIMFADMRDYTGLVEAMDREAAFDVLNQFISAIETAVRDNNGFVNSLEGDAVLALFPGAADDAVGGAIEAHRAVERNIRGETGVNAVRMGIAVHSGELILGTVGNDDRLKCDVFGDPVNVCARLERMTRDHETDIIVSQDTAELLQKNYDMTPLGELSIRGRSKMLEALGLRP
jgi:adenylate cyclase